MTDTLIADPYVAREAGHAVVSHGPVDFGKTADDYARHRAGYPPRFYDELGARGIGVPGQRVVDLGTGTGTVARALAARGSDVVGVDIAARPGVRVNVGGSPGDGFSAEPYLYVGPWTEDRPGDPAYWNAPFGAACQRSGLQGDPLQSATEFLLHGLRLLAG